jgi:hypothetical protein
MTRAHRLWWISGIGALVIGAAFGYFALRPLPRDDEAANPDVGYLIVDSTASAAESLASPPARPPRNGEPPPLSGAVLLDTPKPNQIAESPLWVVGQARGSWFFEAEFPVRLLDARDSVVTWGTARANGDWMTPEYVPFALTLNFSPPASDVGTLVLEKSNPSDLPEHAASVRVPVRFR